MSELTTLTREQIRAVLLGLAEHGSGTEADYCRRGAVDALADALTQPRPVDPELALLRGTLAETLGWDPGQPITDDELVVEVRDTIQRLTTGGDRFRDMLSALLDLDPSADDDTIAEAATARAAQRALGRSAEKTAALVTPASAQRDLAVRLLDALVWAHDGHPAQVVVDRALDEVADQGKTRARLQRRYDDLATAARAVVNHPTADKAGLETVSLALAQVLADHRQAST